MVLPNHGSCPPENIETELLEIYNMRQYAYDYAIECSDEHRIQVTFHDISWHFTPGANFSLTSMEGETVWYDPANQIIYIPFERRFDLTLATHEILHAFGYQHNDPPFTTCMV